MEKITNFFNELSNLMEQDIRGVHIGCYSIALIGLTVAVRKVRPFTQFTNPLRIPNHFIEDGRELTGIVERIEPNGALLMIKHKPIIPLPIGSTNYLPVKISGVNVSGLGISWLQTIVAGNTVKFVPVAKDKDFVQCKVILPQVSNKKINEVNIGESLVSIGFASVAEKPPKTDDKYVSYYNTLKKAEAYALRKKLGIKYYIGPTKNILVGIVRQISKLVNSAPKQKAKSVSKVALT